MKINIKPLPLCILSIALGCLLTLAFAPFDLFIMVPVALSGLLSILRFSKNSEYASKYAFLCGFCFGMGHFTSSLYWISYSLSFEIDKFAWLIPFAVFGIPACLSVFIGILAIAWRWYMVPTRKFFDSIMMMLFFASSWTAFELIRSYIFDFPWNLIGYTSQASINFMQFASVAGVYGLSFIIAIMGSVFFTRNIRAIALVYIFGMIIYTWGYNRLQNRNKDTLKDTIVVRMIQPNIQELHHGDHARIMKMIDRLIDLSTRPGHENVKIIIWPEGAFLLGFSLEDSDSLKQISKIIPKDGFLIAGADRFARDINGNIQIFNSMFVMNDRGQIIDFYDKNILVPFGEYIPFQKLFWFIDKITYGAISFSSGLSGKMLNLPGIGQISPLICYEATFNSLFFNQNQEKFIFLLNITNDLWFKDSIGPIQHFAMSKMRAIEHGTTLVRVANTGLSAIIDLYGIASVQSNLNIQCFTDFSLDLTVKETFYTKHRTAFLNIIITILIASILLRILRIKRFLHNMPHENSQ